MAWQAAPESTCRCRGGGRCACVLQIAIPIVPTHMHAKDGQFGKAFLHISDPKGRRALATRIRAVHRLCLKPEELRESVASSR
jgi:hypothetical protein